MTYLKKIKLSDWQSQFIFGTILGGSTLTKNKTSINYHLSMRGSNKNWILYKAKEIGEELHSQNSFLAEKNYYRWHSAACPNFFDFCPYFMDEDGNKNLNPEVFDKLRDIALSVWFLDAAKFMNRQCILSNKGWDINLISQYFNDLEIPHTLEKAKLIFKRESTEKIFKIIGHLIPEFMIETIL